MTTSLHNANPSQIIFTRSSVIYNNQGLDTIALMGRSESVADRLNAVGYGEVIDNKGTPVADEIKRIERRITKDPKKRYQKEQFQPVFSVFKLPRGSSLSAYAVVIKNSPETLDYDTLHKKPKGTYSMVVFAGLHQPTKRLHHETVTAVHEFTKWKRFKLYKLDIAADVRDRTEINYKRKESFKAQLAPHAQNGVISKGHSLYINQPERLEHSSRILYYDKYHKQTKTHKQNLTESLRDWKRAEITITFDLSRKENRYSFREYFDSTRFSDDLLTVSEIVGHINQGGFNNDYLEYQLNSFMDKRMINNQESRKRFNSVEALERFKTSDFRPYGRINLN